MFKFKHPILEGFGLTLLSNLIDLTHKGGSIMEYLDLDLEFPFGKAIKKGQPLETPSQTIPL